MSRKMTDAETAGFDAHVQALMHPYDVTFGPVRQLSPPPSVCSPAQLCEHHENGGHADDPCAGEFYGAPAGSTTREGR